METRFTTLVGCRYPIQQAGMGGASTVELAAAVSGAGGLGMLALPGAPPEEVDRQLDALAAATGAVAGVNFLMPFLRRDGVEAAASRARVVEFFYGDPDASLVDLGHAGGALVSWQVGSVAEAQAAADAGCDLVVAQGMEAGGHVRGEVALLPLLDGILGAVTVPVVAAGGIGSARGVAAVLAAGADAARIGTRFVATVESGAHPGYIEALVAAGAADTVLTTTFSLMWPDAPHRVLTSCVRAAGPGASLAPSPPTRDTTGPIEAMALYAGQSVGCVTSVPPAAEVVRELVDGAARLLPDRASGRT